jgi:hypothetical protein
MNLIGNRKALSLLVLMVSFLLTGCMAQRPYPYNRPSFHASRDLGTTGSFSHAQLARWQRPANEQLVATATATANSSLERDVSLR